VFITYSRNDALSTITAFCINMFINYTLLSYIVKSENFNEFKTFGYLDRASFR